MAASGRRTYVLATTVLEVLHQISFVFMFTNKINIKSIPLVDEATNLTRDTLQRQGSSHC